MEELPAAIGRFRIEAVLGRGAMGVVYKAHDPDIDRTVAIKLIRADLLDSDNRENYLARFRNEAKVAGRCVHPNIVGVYDFALHAGNPYLVMEHVDGVDLGRGFRPGVPVPVATVIRISLQVLSALAYAHGFGIVHRDIKPANILLTADSSLKVTDFGISHLAATGLTQNTSLLGTPSYMSPEQCRGGSIDQRCDLFSLGCVMHELLGGERVFGGGGFAEILYRLMHVAHRPLRELRPDVSKALSDVVDRALAKNPEDRFESAQAMDAAIRLAEPATGNDDDASTIVQPGLHGAAFAGHQAGLPRLIETGTGAGTGAGTAHEFSHLDGSSLGTIERQLARHLGPIAGYHLRRALRDAQSADEFSRRLMELLPEESQRGSLRGTLELVLAGRMVPNAPATLPPPALSQAATGSAMPGAISPAAVARATQAMAQVMGPIAPRLVARARAKAGDEQEFEALCMAAIDRPDARARFRTLLDRGY